MEGLLVVFFCIYTAMLDVLQRGETDKSFRFDLNKAAEKLGKVLSEVDIRSFMDNMLQKNSTEMYAFLSCYFFVYVFFFLLA